MNVRDHCSCIYKNSDPCGMYSPARNAHARLKDIYLEIHPSSPLLPEKLMAFKAGQTTKVWSVIPRVIKVQ